MESRQRPVPRARAGGSMACGMTSRIFVIHLTQSPDSGSGRMVSVMVMIPEGRCERVSTSNRNSACCAHSALGTVGTGLAHIHPTARERGGGNTSERAFCQFCRRGARLATRQTAGLTSVRRPHRDQSRRTNRMRRLALRQLSRSLLMYARPFSSTAISRPVRRRRSKVTLARGQSAN